MRRNYHTHTTRCNHAIGTEREYIEQAIEAGLELLGFSDHVPYPFEDFDSWFRMEIEDIEDYIETLTELKKEYEKDIEILIGFETEYYPAYFNKLLDILNNYDYDYMILGQHFIENETSGIYSGNATSSEKILKQYVNQSIEALETGKFSYFAHPDLINYIGDNEIYEKYMRKLCKKALELDIPLELNMLGMKDRRHYPCEKFFKIVSEVGNGVIIGCDAHQPEALNDPKTLKECKDFAEKLELKLINELVLKNPKNIIRRDT